MQVDFIHVLGPQFLSMTGEVFNILPSWWATWWARLLFLVIVLVLLVGYVQWRLLSLRRQKKYLTSVVEERTAQVAMQAQKLKQLDMLKSRFFANISHEFRTPLTLILGPIQDALHGDAKAMDLHQLQIMQRSGKRLERLINQLLDLSRLEEDKLSVEKRSQPLKPFLSGIVQAFVSLAEQKQIALNCECEDFSLLFDAEKLEQIVVNLLSNAFKYAFRHDGAGNTIQVAAQYHPATEEAEIIVKDNGVGISQEHLSHIFDRFYQVDTSSTRVHEGSGIGLALVQELVNLHKGRIRVTSEAGVGTCFIITLPGAMKTPASGDSPLPFAYEEAQSALAEMDWDSESIDEKIIAGSVDKIQLRNPVATVLVVEDHADMRRYICSHLRSFYHVLEAENGKQGLDEVLEKVPDLVISDVMMPGMNGYELCQAIKSDEKTRHIPVVLLTALSAKEDKLKGLELRADDYLNKPFSFDELLARVENLIEVRRLVRQDHLKAFALEYNNGAVTSEDEQFAEQVREITESQISNWTFGVEWLAEEMELSPRQLLRRMKEVIGLTPGGYIRMMRLKRAAYLLEHKWGPVSKVAHAVGFQDEKYFSKLFKQTYRVSPSRYVGDGQE